MAQTNQQQPKVSDARVSTIEDAPAPQSAAPKKSAVHNGAWRNWMSGDKVRITIHSGNDDASKAPVFININDYDAHFPRDLEVVIPVEAFESCIEAASYDHLTRSQDGGIVIKPIRRFTYTVHERIKAEAA